MLRRAVIAATMLAVTTGAAFAQGYPNRPVKIVVPYAAGGGTDALTRFIARGLEQRLGQPFIIENRGGSGTTLGATMVARAEADGYTLLMVDERRPLRSRRGCTSGLPTTRPRISRRSCWWRRCRSCSRCIRRWALRPRRSSSRWPRASPVELSYASGGPGAPHHIYCRASQEHDRHRPAARALPRWRSGAERRGGRSRADLFRRRRSRRAADPVRQAEWRSASPQQRASTTCLSVPTLHEAGVAGYEANSWQMMVGPPNMPEPIVDTGQPGARGVHADTGSTKAFHLARHAADDRNSGRGRRPTSELRSERWTPIIRGMGVSVE